MQSLPKPRARLLKTWLKRPRNLNAFAPRISFDEAAADMPDVAVAANFGQAVLLVDAQFALHRDGTVTHSFHLITMLHGDHDLANWDEVVRPYDRRRSLHTFRKSYVHLPDGSRRKAKWGHGAYSQRIHANSLSFYPLRPGVIVDFEEQSDQFRPMDAGPAAWDHMFFHGPPCEHIPPCARLRYTVAIARPFEVRFQLHHCDWQPQEWTRGAYRILQWDLRDLDGIEFDEFTPHARDIVPWVDLTTFPDWSSIGKHYRKELIPKKKNQTELKSVTHDITANATTDRDRLAAIFEYAARDVRYGRHPLELEIEAAREAKSMLEDLRGDCKDKSALVQSMLSEVGIESKIVLVLTRMNGTTPFLPGMRFDHAIVQAKLHDETIWLDPAGGLCSFGELPFNDQGVQALVLDGEMEETTIVPQPWPEQHVIRRTSRGKIDRDGTFSASVEIELTGEHAAVTRTQMQDRSIEYQQRVLGQVAASDLPGATVTQQEFVTLDDLMQPVRMRYQVQLRQWGRRIEDILLFRIPWVESIRMTGPMNAAERIQPMRPRELTLQEERQEIRVPDGFEPYGLPYSNSESCPWGSYTRTIRVQADKLVCDRRMEFRDGIVPADQFPDYKAFWEACAHADAADVVLWSRVSTSTPASDRPS
ncbi:MAG: transglutaminase-like domain-containing protein [Planctomycetota bacterium]|nr:transglutaminase-like domain-containing protein [Planctomycetota bacterium]